MSCLQAIAGEDSENPLICHNLNLLWFLSDKGTHVRFCWIPCNCVIEGNKRVDQLAKETLDHDIEPLASVHYADLKPLVNSYIQQMVQVKWGVAVHGRDLYLLKPTLGPPKKWKHLTGVEEVVITWLRIGPTKVTKSHILSHGPPTACHHCGQTLTIDHMLLECAVLQESRDEYYTVDTLNTLFEAIPGSCIVEFLRDSGFVYLIWTVRHSKQFFTRIIHERMQYSKFNQLLTWTISVGLINLFRDWKQLWATSTCVGRLICPEGHVSLLNKCNPILSKLLAFGALGVPSLLDPYNYLLCGCVPELVYPHVLSVPFIS